MENINNFTNKIINDDCLKVIGDIPNSSIDLIVTDPPYGYSFMGKDWDKVIIGIEYWKECLRVLKPGAFAFIMSSPRQDCLYRMIYNLQEAGFETGFTSIYWTYACLSEDTKILTTNGLRNLNELKKNDIVYSFDIKRNILVKTKINQKFIYGFDGKLYNLKNQNTDQMLTLNHNILYKNKYHSGKKRWWDKSWKYNKPNKIKLHSAIKIPISAKYKGSISIGKNLATLLGWILAEGHFYSYNRANDIRIYQSSVNISNVKEIRNLLVDLHIPYKEYCRKRKYKDKNYEEYCFMFSGYWNKKIRILIPNKKPTNKLLELIYKERLCLYNALIKGDGTRSFYKGKSTDCFYQNNSFTLDWFEMLVISLGWQTKRNRNKQCVSIKKQSDTEFQWSNYCPKLINYKGKIWCIKTKLGNFIAWRNERYFITGNSGFPKALNLEKKTNGKVKGFAGFQPKPAVEIILVVMKSLSEKTYVEQALKNGKGCVNFDECRIPLADKENIAIERKGNKKLDTQNQGWGFKALSRGNKARFPANLLCSDDILNDGIKRKSGKDCIRRKEGYFIEHEYGDKDVEQITYGDSGSFSRFFDLDKWFEEKLKELPENVQKVFPFFIVPKASTSEKNEGCEGLEEKEWGKDSLTAGIDRRNSSDINTSKLTKYKPRNNHPTVKPIKLMGYLITLGSRKNDIVLDPFLGSGTTVLACKMLDRRYIGIENNKDYYEIAISRINEYKKQLELF